MRITKNKKSRSATWVFIRKKHGEDPKNRLNSSIVDPGLDPQVLGPPGSGSFHHQAKQSEKP
jgi:hypothetical protein